MKRFSLVGIGALGLMASFLGGCPIFSDGDGGYSQQCEGDSCGSNQCAQPSDCPANETCGSDGTCHSGDCSFNGCPSGYSCDIDANGAASCTLGTGNGGSGVGGSTASTTSTTSTSGGGATTTSTSSSSSSSSSGNGGAPTTTTSSSSSSSSSTSGSSSSSSSSSSSGAALIYCGHPGDCATGQICAENGTCQAGPCSATNACILGYACGNDGTCQPEVPNSCNSDSDCASGSLCIAGSTSGGGVCTTANNQCFDQSQCSVGEDCVSGKCVLSCTSNSQCRDGYDCNTVTGVCSIVAQSCTVTNDCGSATLVCVGGACVPRSTSGSCDNPNDVWDENGCVPNQAATFTCNVDGAQDKCSSGSICLHHDCWISCDSPNQNACASQPTLDTCKPVVDNGQSYNVCGTSSNLGSMCGPGSVGNQTCSGGAVCIDGYCK